MKRWALIEGGVITAVTEQDAMPTIGGQWVDCTATPEVGGRWTWDGATFAAPTEGATWVIRAEALWDRFTNAQLVDIDVAMQHDPAGTNAAKKAAARLRIFKADTNAAGSINLKKARAKNWFDELVAQAVLTQPQADAIRTAPVDPSEAA